MAEISSKDGVPNLVGNLTGNLLWFYGLKAHGRTLRQRIREEVVPEAGAAKTQASQGATTLSRVWCFLQREACSYALPRALSADFMILRKEEYLVTPCVSFFQGRSLLWNSLNRRDEFAMA